MNAKVNERIRKTKSNLRTKRGAVNCPLSTIIIIIVIIIIIIINIIVITIFIIVIIIIIISSSSDMIIVIMTIIVFPGRFARRASRESELWDEMAMSRLKQRMIAPMNGKLNEIPMYLIRAAQRRMLLVIKVFVKLWGPVSW